MTKINSSKIKLLALTIVSIILFFLFLKSDKDVERIKKNHIVCCGTISSINYGKGGLVILYQYPINGEIIKANGSCSKYTENRFKSGISHNIWVVTEKSDPSVNRLLESVNDFEKYNIVSSDTVGLKCPYMDY